MNARGATTVEAYLAQLPADRRDAVSKVREVVNTNLPAGFEEGIQYGMIGWYVPLARYPETYNGQPLAIAGLASQKGYMALYLMAVYGDPATATWFRRAFAAAGKKLDMGKSCVRFKSLDALPLDVIGETIRRVSLESFLGHYEDARASSKRIKPPAKKAAAAKKAAPARKAPVKRAAPAKKAPPTKKPAPPAKKAPAKRTR